MFSLADLVIHKRDSSERSSFSFVGVRRHPTTRILEFWLPQGFEEFPADNFEEVLKYFFMLYGVVRKFAKIRGMSADDRNMKRDGFSPEASEITIRLADDEGTLTFAKLQQFERIIERFDEMILAAIISKQRAGTPQDFTKIHLHIDRAVFLPNNSFMLDSMPTQHHELEDNASALVGMFSYVYCELLGRIDAHEFIHPEVRARADAYKGESLTSTSSLFDSQSFHVVLNILKEQLQRIHRQTSYKDEDYWTLFEALEFFLYGDSLSDENDGQPVWGISDFYPIWEEMCFAAVHKEYKEDSSRTLRYSDRSRTRGNGMEKGTFGKSYPFVLRFGKDFRTLFPDFIGSVDHQKRARNSFDKLFRIKRGKVTNGFHAAFRVSPVPDSAISDSWFELLKRKVNKASFTPRRLDGNAIDLARVPEKRIAEIFESVFSEYARQNHASGEEWFIVDFKYVSPLETIQESLSAKLRADIRKQLIYELALREWLAASGTKLYSVDNQLILPRYEPTVGGPIRILNDSTPTSFGKSTINPQFAKAGLSVLALSFEIAASAWLLEAS